MSITELKNKQVACRKDHRCCWCGEVVEAKSLAQYRSGVFEENFFSDYFHPECYGAMVDSDFDGDDEFCPMEQVRGKTWEESNQ